MKHSRMKKWIVPALAVTLALGMGTSAFAQGGRDNKDNDHKNNERRLPDKNQTIQLKIDFKDTQGKEFEWALRYIMSLANRGIFDGYPDGSFRPQETVSRIEAITAAVRLMGLRDQAESAEEKATKLNFNDAAAIPSWAVGYVAVALENDLFGETDTNVNPNQPADRLWATTLLIKALKLQDEAEANMNAKLPFADAKAVPAGSVGYVKVAVDKGLVNGFEDNTFRPKQLVTRAQIAALLDRAGNQLPSNNDGLITGTVSTLVSGNVLTFRNSVNGQTSSMTLDANVFIYRNGARVSASSLLAGDSVKIRYYNNTIIYIEVTQLSGGTPSTPTQAVGVKTGMVAAAVTGNTLTLVSGGQTITLPLNAGVLFFRNGVQIQASGLQLGDIVSTRSYNYGVSFVEVTQPVGTTGTPTNYDSVESGTIAFPIRDNVLLMNTSSQVKGLPLNSSAVVYRNGSLTNLAALQVGDIVTTYAYNNYVAVIEVTKSVAQVTTTGEMTGTVVGPIANNQLTLTSGGQSYQLQLHANSFLYLNGAASSVGILLPGDVIKAHYYNGLLVSAEVTQRADGSASSQPTITEKTGTIISASNNVLILVSGNQAEAITLNDKAFVYRGGSLISAFALQAGDVVKVRSYNNSALFAEVTQLTNANNQQFSVSGTFNSVTFTNQGKIATITINQTGSNGSNVTTTYNVSSSVTITGNIANLVSNHAIVLQGVGAVINQITIQ
ncbi:S-layer homology domain-containing protein [Paenibacillus roseipurpureus]|uniref:S-layer homology domain-containing protein n=1 Tax=Paenibacillus roseopurpureus TaxID=2918901 RepID=A0AA96LQ54_9BACL|nr:S-layer homology domain-containing protein [Paenibacillus sp. MBLB1832]WNR46217.1 S-layer homology domain-containing protein [Paenibacillus sp. MBLB1832]